MHEYAAANIVAPLVNIVRPVTTQKLVKDGDYDSQYFRNLERHGMLLNDYQLRATRKTEGPLLIMAGAGSGKSLCIAAKIGYLIKVKGISPASILAITFTKKATKELKSRIDDVVGNSSANPIICTFHSLFLKILRSNGYGKHRIIIDTERVKIIRTVLRNLGLQGNHYSEEDLLSRFALYKNRLIDPVAATNEIMDTKQIYQEYEKYKRRYRLLDFEDILLETYKLLDGNPIILSYYQNQFKYICVDEFQDISPVQYKIIQMLSTPRNNLCVVGDWRQTIFSFCGSDVNLILGFQKVYPDAEIIDMDINYRSSAGIVALGNYIIGDAKYLNKSSKATWSNHSSPCFSRPDSPKEEAENIISVIKKGVKDGQQYKDYAILYRTCTASRTLLETFLEEEIPLLVHNSGKVLYEEYTIKPIVDALRLSLDPFNLNALNSILPVIYLNHLNLYQIKNYIKKMAAQHPKVPLIQHLFYVPGLSETEYEHIQCWIDLLKQLKNEQPCSAIERIRSKGGYDKLLGIEDETREESTDSMDELMSSAAEFQTVHQFISHIDRIIERKKRVINQEPESDAVSLMSIHSSKGLQFHTVFVIGCTEGILPHAKAIDVNLCRDSLISKDESLEEEKRLLYVAVTRAKEKLYISSPQMYNNKTVEVSRYLREAIFLCPK